MFHFSVKSKIFKNPLKSDWFNARIFVDTEKKELHFSNPTNNTEADDVEYETGDVKEDEKVEIEPPVVKLIEFKQPKRKMPKKEGGQCSLEFNGRALFSGKSLRLRSNDVSTFQEFFDLVNPLFAEMKSNNKNSIIDDPESICGDYATVAADHETVCDEHGEMSLVPSKIYDSFEPELSFPVTLHESTSSADDVLNRLRIEKDDQLHLYMEDLQLLLLGRDDCLVASWKYNQIKEFRFNETMLKITFGRRTITGAVSLTFKLDPAYTLDLSKLMSVKLSELNESDVINNLYYDNVDSDICSNRIGSVNSCCTDDYYTSVKKTTPNPADKVETLTPAMDAAATAAATAATASSSADTESVQSHSDQCDTNDTSNKQRHHQKVEKRQSQLSEELRLKINSVLPGGIVAFGGGAAGGGGGGGGGFGKPLLPPRVVSVADGKRITFSAEY